MESVLEIWYGMQMRENEKERGGKGEVKFFLIDCAGGFLLMSWMGLNWVVGWSFCSVTIFQHVVLKLSFFGGKLLLGGCHIPITTLPNTPSLIYVQQVTKIQ